MVIATEIDVATPHSSDLAILDAHVLQQLSAARHPAWTESVIVVFIDELRNKRAQLATAVSERESAQIRRLAHSLIGSAGMVGANALVKMCREIEVACRRQSEFNSSSATKLIDVLNATLDAYTRYRCQGALPGTG